MAGTGNPAPRQPRIPAPRQSSGPLPLRKPPQVMMLKKEAGDRLADQPPAPAGLNAGNTSMSQPPEGTPSVVSSELVAPLSPSSRIGQQALNADVTPVIEETGLTMADLLGPEPRRQTRQGRSGPSRTAQHQPEVSHSPVYSVDDFDFDEESFLAALDENEPVGATGEVVSGVVIAIENDGVYIDIGGKAPGFMPKIECGLGVIVNLKERFPKGKEVEVIVTREQNADGMVTISARALELRNSWQKVRKLQQESRIVSVKVNGFNRGGVTCDLEGLRGFIPRSHLLNGTEHEAMVGKTIGAVFLEVDPDTRKLVLSEKKAATASRFSELEVGQLVEGRIASIKPYGYFVDIGGVIGLLHHSCVTGSVLRDRQEIFQPGDAIKALVTQLDPGRGRVALNTALLEGQPGEILISKEIVMAEAEDRANRARSLIRQQEQDAG